MDKTAWIAALIADDRQYPYIAVPGLWRVARKPHECVACAQLIEIGQRYFDYTGESPMYQSGKPYHRTCAIDTWRDYIGNPADLVPAEPVDR